MPLPNQIAKHIREIHVGGNWTDSNLKGNLADVTATSQVFINLDCTLRKGL